MIIDDKTCSRVGLLIAFYLIFYDAISYYQDVTLVSAGIAVFVCVVFFLRLSLRGIDVGILALIVVFFVSNVLGVVFSEYDLKYKYAFYRIFPLMAAWFVYCYCDRLALRRLLVFGCIVNVVVALYECFNGVDLFQSQDVLYFADYFGGVVRGNGLFWYSLVYSSFLLYSVLLLLSLSESHKISLVFSVFVLVGSIVSFNKMSCMLLGVVVVYAFYEKVKLRYLNSFISKIVFFVIGFLLLFLVLWFFGFFDFIEVALKFDSAANSERFKFWLSGWEEFSNFPFLAKILGINLGVYERYGNGFESQYIQFLAEYGIFGCLAFVVMAWRMIKGGYYFQTLVVFVSLVTVRALDSYASAFLIYLLVFCSSVKDVAFKGVK